MNSDKRPPKVFLLVAMVIVVIFIGFSLYVIPRLFYPSSNDQAAATGTLVSQQNTGFGDELSNWFHTIPCWVRGGSCGPVTPNPGSQNTSSTYKGMYVLTPQIYPGSTNSLAATTYTLPYIDGVSVRIAWNTFEPQSNQYDWSAFDAVVKPAVANNKKLTIAIATGIYTPSWVYAEGAKGLTFSTTQSSNSTTCITETQPIPWDTIYQRSYASMMQGIAAHLRSIPGAYDAVKVVKVTGMTENTEELHLITTHPDKHSPSCVSDAIAQWQAAGYLPSKVVASWLTFANDINAAFPHAILVQHVIGTNDFPYINEMGVIVDPSSPSYVNPGVTIFADGISNFSSRFGGIFDALAVQSFNADAQSVENVALKGGIAAYQTNEYGGTSQGAQCGADQSHGGKGTTVPCTNATFLQLLQNGIAHHGTYFEVFEPNAIAFPQAIASARTSL